MAERHHYGRRSWRHVRGNADRTDAGIRWHWSGTQGYYDALNDPNDDDVSRVTIFLDHTKETGFYHLTRRTEQFYVRSNGLSTEDEEAILDAILIAIDEDAKYASEHAVVATMIRAGIRKETYPIEAGFWRNLYAALAALALIVCCIRGRPWEWFREPRLGFYSKYSLKERRVRRGECASCGYDLSGLESGRCPECGTDTDGSTEPSEHAS